MPNERFERLEAWFHEARGLGPTARLHLLERVATEYPAEAHELGSLLAAADGRASFLDTSAMDASLPHLVGVNTDGSVTLAGRYTLRERIGIGASSSVLRATTTSPDRSVAVKLLRFGVGSERVRDRFHAEARALAAVSHPHIAHIYETGVHRFDTIDVPWIAMEYVNEARPLRELPRDPERSTSDKRTLFFQILEAVHAAHTRGILHLDLNGSNILIDPHGFPKIIDFGLAGLTESDLRAGHPLGTRLSAAPEQLGQQSAVPDRRADIYAMALLYVELMHGVRLQWFPGASDAEAIEMIREGVPLQRLMRLRKIDPSVKHALALMLNADPAARPDSLRAARTLLERGRTHTLLPRRTRYVRLAAAVCLCSVALFGLGRLIPVASTFTTVHQDQRQHAAIILSSQTVLALTNKNPRRFPHAKQIDDVIDEVAASLSHNPALPSVDAAALHASLANRFEIAGRYNDSIRSYLVAIEAFDRTRDTQSQAMMRLDLAELLIFLNRYEEADEILSEIDDASALGFTPYLRIGIATVQSLFATGRHDAAAAHLLRLGDIVINDFDRSGPDACEGDPPGQVEVLLDAARLASVVGQPQLQHVFYREAERLARDADRTHPELRPIVAISRARAHLEHDTVPDYARASHSIREAVESLERSGDDFHAAWGRRQLGHTLFRQGDRCAAVSQYAAAEKTLRSLLGTTHHETRLAAAYLHLADGRTESFERATGELRGILGDAHPALTMLDNMRRVAEAAPGFQHPDLDLASDPAPSFGSDTAASCSASNDRAQ